MTELSLKDLSKTELNHMQMAINEELRKREVENRVYSALEELVLASNLDREPGSPWQQPVTPSQTYMVSDEVEHDGKVWVSTHDFNSAEPGVSGWRLVASEDEPPPPYLQPSGAHDAYQEGERITWTDGGVYSATRDGVTHNPEQSPSDWALVTEEVDPEEPDEEEPNEDEVLNWDGNGVYYEVGTKVGYGGITYTVVQTHTSQPGWLPDILPSLYSPE